LLSEKPNGLLHCKLDFQMASIAQAIIEAGQKKWKAARKQLESIESEKKNNNPKQKRLVASASELCYKKQGVPDSQCKMLLFIW